MFFHRRLPIILLILLSLQSFSQDNRQSAFVPQFSLRTTPLSLLEVDGNFGIGVQYRWAERWAAVIDPAFIFLSTYEGSDNMDRDRFSGIKLRADVRYYFEKNRKGVFNTFVAPELHYKLRNAKRWDDFGINCLNGNCDYFQNAQYTERKTEFGFAIKIGTVLPLSQSLDVELYAGAGLKEKKFTQRDLPTGGSFLNPPDNDPFRFWFSEERRDRFRPMLPAGLKLVLRL